MTALKIKKNLGRNCLKKKETKKEKRKIQTEPCKIDIIKILDISKLTESLQINHKPTKSRMQQQKVLISVNILQEKIGNNNTGTHK